MLPQNEGGKRGAYSHDVILARGLDFIRENKDSRSSATCRSRCRTSSSACPEDSDAPYRGKFPEEPLPTAARLHRLRRRRDATFAGWSPLDDGVGRSSRSCDELGLDENTLIVFTSDNGPQGGRWHRSSTSSTPTARCAEPRTTLYEGGIRVPLIARWPGKIKPGDESDRVCGFQDHVPTLAEAAAALTPCRTSMAFRFCRR